MNWRNLIGWAIGVAAAAVIAVMLGWTLHLDGVVVPNDPTLGDLAAVADATDGWVGPSDDVKTSCQLESRLGEDELEQLDLVYPDGRASCEIREDSLDADTWIGVVTAALLAAAIGGLVVAAQSNRTVRVIALVAAFVAGLVLGALIAALGLAPGFSPQWEFFWRGFATLAILALSGWIAHEAHRE